MTELPTVLTDAIRNHDCLALVLSRKRKASAEPIEKLTVRPVVVRERPLYQLSSRFERKEAHENLDAEQTLARLSQLLGTVFEHCHLFAVEADYTIRVKPGGAVKIKKSKPTRERPTVEHNRSKQYLIPEGVPCPFLIDIGVMTRQGKVRADKYQKFRQINRFLELVDDVLPHLPREGRLRIVDFGCGKSYLTFALHHLLTEIHGRDVHVVGLDRNAEVVATCTQIAERLHCQGLEFHIGDIAGYEAGAPVDLVVSLHACDTATDDALAQAVHRQAAVILAVPCCQHELAGKIPSDSPLLQHGILKERFAALATDALRAQALEICGYKTQVVEFIDMEHTAKNLLIRALRRADSNPQLADSIAAYRSFKQSLEVDELYLEQALGEDFTQLMLSEATRIEE
jgi:SAM-dependent methyltransferase